MESLRKVVNQKLATSNLNLRAPNFGQKGEIGKIAATTETTDGAGDLMEVQIGGISAPTATPWVQQSNGGKGCPDVRVRTPEIPRSAFPHNDNEIESHAAGEGGADSCWVCR